LTCKAQKNIKTSYNIHLELFSTFLISAEAELCLTYIKLKKVPFVLIKAQMLVCLKLDGQ